MTNTKILGPYSLMDNHNYVFNYYNYRKMLTKTTLQASAIKHALKVY